MESSNSFIISCADGTTGSESDVVAVVVPWWCVDDDSSGYVAFFASFIEFLKLGSFKTIKMTITIITYK